MEEFGVVKVRRQVIEQARDLEQFRPRPTYVVDLSARLGNTRLPRAKSANHGTTLRFSRTVIVRLRKHGNNANRRRARITVGCPDQPATESRTLSGIERQVEPHAS
jgi:hypothetical protein